MVDDIGLTCVLCGGESCDSGFPLPGFQEPLTFRVLTCRECGASRAAPMAPCNSIYGLIYRNAWRIPDYDLYLRLAEDVRWVHDPLSWLSSSRATYWFIERYLRQHAAPGSRVLDCGCGLGYLTYAISKRGYDAVGIELTQEAVAAAKKRYGDLFRRTDLRDGETSGLASFDVVICTAVIEHLEDPVALLRSLRGMVKDDGVVLVTTPDRSIYPASAVWETDLPPVHWWWFTPRSVESMAALAGFSAVRFGDFDGCDIGRARVNPDSEYRSPKRRPVFDESGRMVAPPQTFNQYLWGDLVCRNLYRRLGLVERHDPQPPSRRSRVSQAQGGVPTNIAAILTP